MADRFPGHEVRLSAARSLTAEAFVEQARGAQVIGVRRIAGFEIDRAVVEALPGSPVPAQVGHRDGLAGPARAQRARHPGLHQQRLQRALRRRPHRAPRPALPPGHPGEAAPDAQRHRQPRAARARRHRRRGEDGRDHRARADRHERRSTVRGGRRQDRRKRPPPPRGADHPRRRHLAPPGRSPPSLGRGGALRTAHPRDRAADRRPRACPDEADRRPGQLLARQGAGRARSVRGARQSPDPRRPAWTSSSRIPSPATIRSSRSTTSSPRRTSGAPRPTRSPG